MSEEEGLSEQEELEQEEPQEEDVSAEEQNFPSRAIDIDREIEELSDEEAQERLDNITSQSPQVAEVVNDLVEQGSGVKDILRLIEALLTGADIEETQSLFGEIDLLKTTQFWERVRDFLSVRGFSPESRSVNGAIASFVRDEVLIVPLTSQRGCTGEDDLRLLWTEMTESGESGDFPLPSFPDLSAYQILESGHWRTEQLNLETYRILFRNLIRRKETSRALRQLSDLFESYAEQVYRALQWMVRAVDSRLVPPESLSIFITRDYPLRKLDEQALLLFQQKSMVWAFLRVINFDIDQTWAGAKALVRVIDSSLGRETAAAQVQKVGRTRQGRQRKRRESQKGKGRCPPCPSTPGESAQVPRGSESESEVSEEGEIEQAPQEEELEEIPLASSQLQDLSEFAEEDQEEEQQQQPFADSQMSNRSRDNVATRRPLQRSGGAKSKTAKTTIDKKSWGHRKYEIEAYALRNINYGLIRTRDDILLLQDLRLLASLPQGQCLDLNAQAQRMWLLRQKKIAKLFHLYIEQFQTLMQKGETALFFHNLIPTPFAQSTYLVQDTESVELCNLFMWPDRLANTLNPLTLCLTEHVANGHREPKVRSHILSDLHDPWYWYYYRENFFPTTLGDRRVLMSKIALYFARAQGGDNSIVYTPSFEELDDFEDPDLFNGSSRVTVNPEDQPEQVSELIRRYRNLPDGMTPRQIYTIQYMNRLARGVNVYVDPENANKPYVMGEHVFLPSRFTWTYVVDVIRTVLSNGQVADRLIQRDTSSEFTLYMEALQPFTCITTDSTLGSYISYKIDLHPALEQTSRRQETGVSVANAAGHVYHVNLVPAQDDAARRLPWFKELLKKKTSKKGRKEQGTSREEELTEFAAWLPKTIAIDVVCDNSTSYDWKTFPEWMVLMFKLLLGIAYWARDNSEYEQFMILVPLDRLKRIGNVPENLFVYMMRRYLNFGLAMKYDQVLKDSAWKVYTGIGGESYFIDLWIRDFAKIYTFDQSDLLELDDPTEPYLLRPVPTVEEAWKMFQFYTQHILVSAVTRDDNDSTSERTEYPTWISNLNEFLRADEDLKSSRLRGISLASAEWAPEDEDGNKKYTMDYVKQLRDSLATFDPLAQDTVPIDWSTSFPPST